MKFRKILTKVKVSLALIALINPVIGFASDHDDGITPIKTRHRNITDIYAFREDNQTGDASDKENLIVIMNSNPRSPGGKQEYFDPKARYEINFSQLAASQKNVTPTGHHDLRLSFSFSKPDQRQHQKIKVKVIRRAASGMDEIIDSSGEGSTGSGRNGYLTTTLAESKTGDENINHIRFASGLELDVFAGLREDPFFFDVDQFFKVRAGAAGLGPKVGFLSPSSAVDFTIGYNVNSIVVRIPLAKLKGPILDIWGTVSLNGKQIERLARPAINEGLIITNAFLNAFNMIPPSADFSDMAAPVREEAVKVLNAFDMIDGVESITAGAVVTAFLPDVMRLDTRANIPVGTVAYNADLSGDKGMLTGGRKLEDDVIDITLSLLVAGDPTGAAVKDNVSYAGTPGNPNQGHKLLHGQSMRLGPAEFPFVSRPD